MWPDPKMRAGETDAATQAAVHANTPMLMFFDALGRSFLMMAHNHFERNETIIDERYRTYTEFDIEGNHRAVRDALDRTVMRYDYDMLGNCIHQASMEAGERWMLSDVSGKSIRAWDSRAHAFRTEYDELRRSVRSFVVGDDPQNSSREKCIEVTVYGESAAHAPAELNLRGKPLLRCDSAGVVVNADTNPLTSRDEAYDSKGNGLRTRRRLVQNYKETIDWSMVDWAAVGTVLSADPLHLPDLLAPLSTILEEEGFISSASYDALNRFTANITPDGSDYHPTYNATGQLRKVDLSLMGVAARPFVTNIAYDAKGRRVLIEYGNTATTAYTYDRTTFRLINLKTTRSANLNGPTAQLYKDPVVVQDLNYTYDPIGNITRIADEAAQTVFYNNQQVNPDCIYTYDAVYRLISASGREHISQSAFFNPSDGNYRDYPFAGAAQLGDLQALRNYSESFDYDAVGNLLQLRHQAANGSWPRNYSYNEPSLLEPGMVSNRLSNTTFGSNNPALERYQYDAHGNVTSMPHLPRMQWDFKDELRATSRQVVNEGAAETTYYVYDASGQRVRKVTETQNGTRKTNEYTSGALRFIASFLPAEAIRHWNAMRCM
jgi:YD repeat-containing protein